MKTHSPIMIFFAGLFASPAVAAWMLSSTYHDEGRRGKAAGLKLAGPILTFSVFFLIILFPFSWKIAALLWLFFLCSTSAVIGILAQFSRPESRRSAAADGWGKRCLVAITIVFVAVPSLFTLNLLIINALFGRFLSWISPAVVDPSVLFKAITSGSFSSVLWVVVFIVISIRRGKFLSTGDFVPSILSWMWLLFLKVLMVNGILGALAVGMFGAEIGWAFAEDRLFVSGLIFGLVLPFLALMLAWGSGSWYRKGAVAAVVMICVLGSTSVLFGMLPWAECAAGRSMERSGDPSAALQWYGRSLLRRSNPLVVSYLQHRVGLLNYKLGRTDKAMASFRMLQTSHDAHGDLVRQADLYLDRLARNTHGKRVVLPGVETRTELRAAYCAPNTLALVLNYFGKTLSASDVGEHIALIYQGSASSDIVQFCNASGYEHILIPFSDEEDIRFLIGHGVPMLAYVPKHVLAVFGYDDRLGTLVAYDTNTWNIWVDHPIPDFFETWSETLYLGAVILPPDSSPHIQAVRERYRTKRAKAAWHTWQAMEAEDPAIQIKHYLSALRHDPAYFPAVFPVHESFPAYRSTLSSMISMEALMEQAQGLLKRRYFDNWRVAADLADFLLDHRKYKELLHLADDLEKVGALQTVKIFAGMAAFYDKDYEKAVRFLGSRAGDLNEEGWMALGESQLALGMREEAVESFAKAIENCGRFEGEILDRAFAHLETLAAHREPAFLLQIHRRYLHFWPYDAERQLRYADLCVQAVEKGGKDSRKTLLRARQAASIARSLGKNEKTSAEAALLLERILEKLRRF